MDNKLISIGKMADQNHISVATLRLYDEKGLLSPAYIDPETNYRYYTFHQNARLDLIRSLKELGMNLKEIKDTLDEKNIDALNDILLNRYESISKEMSALALRKDEIARTLEGIERYRHSPTSGSTTLEYIPERNVFSMKCERDFYQGDIDDYEETLQIFRTALIDRGMKESLRGNFGTSISLTDFKQNHNRADQIFVFVDALQANCSLKSGMYACMYVDSYEKESEGIRVLKDYIQSNHYEPISDYICEIITELNLLEETGRNMFLRLQIPVNVNV